MTGTLGSGAKTIHFIAHACFCYRRIQTAGGSSSTTHLRLGGAGCTTSRDGECGARQRAHQLRRGSRARGWSSRKSFQRMFEARHCERRAQDAASSSPTRRWRVTGQSKKACTNKPFQWKIYQLDRAVVVNTVTGVHSTVTPTSPAQAMLVVQKRIRTISKCPQPTSSWWALDQHAAQCGPGDSASRRGSSWASWQHSCSRSRDCCSACH